ncbi:extracellular solute-binding protein [Paenibacillus alkalitolerans]|uniref:extracellular solute-binding protein n=1 Tax=Paenibacillus alkalitolerans TaxID=2799335 RepID=UPI0018F4A7C1|nr:extracellular solute-binding protein [Paenibacillus alkalitolerans]
MKRGRKKKAGSMILSLLLTAALSACAAPGGTADNAVSGLDREDSGSLKVAYFDEQPFLMQYGNAFQAMFPNVELEVVPIDSVFESDDPVAEMEKLVEEQKPDVIYLTEEQYSALAKKGQLYDLEAAVKQDEFDIDGFHSSVIELLKAHGGGKLYGLSPSFSSMALYYNKNLFDAHGVPYPTDGMSWEEVLQLASRFPVKKDGDDALLGLFQTTDPFELIRMIGEAKGLLYADADSGKVSIDTPEWKEIFRSVIDGYKSGGISMPSAADGGMGMMRSFGGRMAVRIGPDMVSFMTGQAAMAIDDPMLMNMMGRGEKSEFGLSVKQEGGKEGGPANPFKDFEWDVVTVPVDPSQPDVTGTISLTDIFSINAASENLPAAWEFLKYAAGEQLAKTNAKSSPVLSSRTAYKPEADGKNIDAFYALNANVQSLLQTLPEGFAESFAQMASEQIKKAVDGTQTVDEALAAIQSQGQDLLTKAKAETDQE